MSEALLKALSIVVIGLSITIYGVHLWKCADKKGQDTLRPICVTLMGSILLSVGAFMAGWNLPTMDGLTIGLLVMIGLITMVSVPTFRMLRRFQMPVWSYVAVLTPSLILVILAGVSGYLYGPLAAIWALLGTAIVFFGIGIFIGRRRTSPNDPINP